MYRFLSIFLFSFIVISCSGNPDADEPQTPDLATGELFDLYSPSSATEVFYGEENDYIVGRIEDAKYHGSQVYIVDGAADSKVMVLSEEGEHIQQVGNSGRGPGEYQSPVSMQVSDEELILLDQNLSRITRYGNNDGAGEWEVESSGVHDMNMSDLCVSEGEIWVHSASEGNIIHQISSDLESVTRSFGREYKADEMIQWEISRDGVLACGDQYIYSGFSADNKIRLYDKNDGTMHREISFEEIVPVEISIVNRNDRQMIARSYYPGEAYNEKGDYNDSLQNILIINDHLLVQYTRSFEDVESDTTHTVSLNVNLDDGSYVMTEDWPPVFDYTDGTLLTGANYPLPHMNLNSLSR